MREELKIRYEKLETTRITPAHAGRIRQIRLKSAFPEDHPRACGKNVWKLHWLSFGLGSPPRMREEYLGHGIRFFK